jgi:protein-L-isoaspartate(D-aspartate) O-methyltransferase
MPYDRLHATCAVAKIPYAWVEQVRPGGIIVTPWQPTISYGWKARLTTDGLAAYGRFHGRCGYMMLRDQRVSTFWQAHHAEEADSTLTRLDPRTIDQSDPGIILAATGRVPRLAMFRETDSDGSFSLLLSEVGDPENGSWAACDYEPGKDRFEVHQYGDRRLWDELEDTFYWWIRHGSPTVERFGLVVSPEGQNMWLDDPTRLV